MWQTGSDLKGKGPLNDILANVILLGQVEKLPGKSQLQRCNETNRPKLTHQVKFCVSPVSNTLAYQKAG